MADALSPKKTNWTLKSVANALGVSTATVSNAFNRPGQMSASTREHILAACAQMGYSGPNKAAQSLRKGTFDTIALILPDTVQYMVSDPVASHFMRGVASVFEQQQKHLLLFSGRAEHLNQVADFVDGFICYGRPRNALLVEQLRITPKHVVTVDFSLSEHASVNVNNQQAAYAIARYALAKLGKPTAKVAILGLRLVDDEQAVAISQAPQWDAKLSVAHQRLAGFQQALAEQQLTVMPHGFWSISESTAAAALPAVKALLALPQRPDLVLCMSDLIALCLIQTALNAGVRVPEQMRVVGFDGIDEGQRFSPKLTTVCQNNELKGQQAATLFFAKTAQAVMIDCQLLHGDSA